MVKWQHFQEMEISAAELKTFKDEASELSRSREQLQLAFGFEGSSL
jgi:hypothetical protein